MKNKITFIIATAIAASTIKCQTTSWTNINYNTTICQTDNNCTYLTNQYNISYPCCASATLISPQGTYTTIGTGCVSSAVQYYNSFFAYANGTRVLIKCSSKLSYLPIADN
jgi:hypothetical protein